jgi:hypothetical protein
MMRPSKIEPAVSLAIAPPPYGQMSWLLCGAANPGCSRLSASSLRLRVRWFLPQETLPKGSSVARVNVKSAKRLSTVRIVQWKSSTV